MALTLRRTKHKQFAPAQATKAGGCGNLIFSPLCIFSALYVVAVSACGNTLDELLAVLGVGSLGELAKFIGGLAESALTDGSSSGGPRVVFASGLWHDKTRTLKPTYRDAVIASYKAEVHAMNFRRKVRVHCYMLMNE
ncbi:hypothetical protein QOZ80_7AG0580810 [Eleusine coracana subsp. coracana]|nr:hypothetical protein QOZ80_7AG0580810 [Eleusine coracana subsp. coracana]